MVAVEKYIILISLIFLSFSTWFYITSPSPFSLLNYLTILLPVLLLTLLMILIVRLMGRAPKGSIPIITHTTISVWPPHNKRRRVWISAALVKNGDIFEITTFGHTKNSSNISDIVSSLKTANALLITLKNGEKWEVGGVDSLEVTE
ncbi:hypothetical protein KAH37_08190 [bacterium]|nr:hypothetical protein [bacterium]